MTRSRFHDWSDDSLLKRFVELALGQDDADLDSDTERYNRLFRQMRDVVEELERRPGDGRRVLVRLYDHPNAQVRKTAADATLAVAPDAARRVLQTIVDRREFPQAGDAGMTLRMLDRGTYKPA